MSKKANDQSSKLAKHVLIAMVLGISIGILAEWLGPKISIESWVSPMLMFFDNLLKVIGQLFILSMKMLVIPLVLFSLITGVSSTTNIATLGRVGAKTIGLYIFTTIVAVTLALIVATFFDVGRGASHIVDTPAPVAPISTSLMDSLIHFIPDNPIAAMANGNIFQVIVFAVLVGISLSLMGKKGTTLKKFFSDMNDLTMRLVLLIMKFSPYGIFALLVETFSRAGYSIAGTLFKYIILTVLTLAFQFFCTNGFLFYTLTRLNFFHLIKKIRPALVIAFSTASSNATLPTTLALVEKKVGVDNRIASFTIPLGATINMDGSAIMQAMATLFIANAYQIDLSFANYLMIVFTVLLASIGAAGVPGTGIITLAIVLQQVGLPIEGIALIIGIDRIIEMIRTMVNVFGDVVVAAIVAQSEGHLDLKKFNHEA